MADYMSSCRRQSGFTYLTALFLVAGVGVALGGIGELYSHSRQRENEAELIWIGNQFKQAIGSYYERSPGTMKRYPEKLEDLVEDRRFLTTQRHLRRIYADPMTGKSDWRLVAAPAGGIMGVRTSSATIQKTERRSFAYEPPVSGR
jgi:type II secretory pathway pseudopilin PulG